MSKVSYVVNGREVTREEFNTQGKDDWLEAPPMTADTYSEHDPLISDGLGCMKSQVPEMRQTIKQHGIKGVQVKDNGQVVITSRRGRRDLLRIRGLVDNDGSYGD